MSVSPRFCSADLCSLSYRHLSGLSRFRSAELSLSSLIQTLLCLSPLMLAGLSLSLISYSTMSVSPRFCSAGLSLSLSHTDTVCLSPLLLCWTLSVSLSYRHCLSLPASALLDSLCLSFSPCFSQKSSFNMLNHSCCITHICIYSCAHKFTCPLQNMQNVNNFNKIRGMMKIACYCLFNTVLNKLFHITHVYIFSTIQNNN